MDSPNKSLNENNKVLNYLIASLTIILLILYPLSILLIFKMGTNPSEYFLQYFNHSQSIVSIIIMILLLMRSFIYFAEFSLEENHPHLFCAVMVLIMVLSFRQDIFHFAIQYLYNQELMTDSILNLLQISLL